MTLRALCLLLVFSTIVAAGEKGGSPDPKFARVPFDEWVTSAKTGPFKWGFTVSKPQLSVHQRLFAQLEVLVDGQELSRRKGKGELVFFLQIKDSKGAIYQDHGNIDLGKVEDGVKASNITFTDNAFFLPGDYHIDVAIYATESKEYGVRKANLHVNPLLADPLATSWRDLPPVEFKPNVDMPDCWYLPTVHGRVQLAAAPSKPLQIDLIMNLTPSERDSSSLRVQDRNMSVLIPALKLLTQADFKNSSVNVSTFDLARQRITFKQDDVRELDWPRLKKAFAATEPGVIDVKSLENRQQKARFFIRELNRRVGESPSSRVIIILSSAVAFAPGEDMEALRLETPTDCRVFYIRYEGEPVRIVYGPTQPVYRSRRSRAPNADSTLTGPPPDQLAPLLKALSPKVFDIKNANDLRRALASILNSISAI